MSEALSIARTNKTHLGNVAVLVILALVAYFLFFREQTSKQNQVTRHREHTPNPLNLSSNVSTDETQSPLTGTTVDNPSPKTPETLAPELRPLPPQSAPPPSPALRTKPLIRKKSLQWSDEGTSSKPLHSTHPDNMMQGGGRAEVSYTRKAPEERLSLSDPEGYVIDLKLHSAFKLSPEDGIPPEALKVFQAIEKLAYFDARGGVRFSERDVSGTLTGDPMRDGWDQFLGPLPILAIEACRQVAGLIGPEKVEIVKQIVQNFHKHDKGDGMFWGKFTRRAGGRGKALDPSRLALGWFTDTYRCVDRKMTVPRRRSNKLHDTKAETQNYRLYYKKVEDSGAGTALRCLLWLEILASHFVRLRVLSDQGLYLNGCAARLKVPSVPKAGSNAEPAPTMESNGNSGPNEGSNTGSAEYDYRMVLEVFTQNGEDWRAWIQRVKASFRGVRGALQQLVFSMEYLNSKNLNILDLCQERLVIVRPGWPISAVGEDYVGNDEATQRVPILKDPDVSLVLDGEFKEEHYEMVDQLAQLVNIIQPTHGLLLDQRQFHLDTSTVTPENSRINAIDCWVALLAFVEGKEDKSHRYVKIINFGSHLPIKVGEAGPKFFPLNRLVNLTEVVIPYIKPRQLELGGKSYGPFDIGRLLLDPAFGVEEILAKKKVVNNGVASIRPLKVVIAMTGAQHNMVVWDIQKAFRTTADSFMARQKDNERTPRELMDQRIFDYLTHVYTSDHSIQGGTIRRVGDYIQ